MNKHLVLAGGGHAHMVTLATLHRFVEKGYDVSVIGPSEYHYYSGMGPGMLGRTYRPEDIRFATRHVVEKAGGRFVQGKIVRIDAENQTAHLESGQAVNYDVLSCNLGSHVLQDIVRGGLESIYPVKPIERLLEAQRQIRRLSAKKKIAVGVVGGGPSAVEISGNVWRLTREPDRQAADIKIFTSKTLMPHHPQRVRSRALGSLKRRGINIFEDCDVREIRTGGLTEASGRSHELDIIFVATGVKPSRVFENSGIPTGPDGGMAVNRYLQSIRYNTLFGGGDCIYFQEAPLDKVGVYAVRQNPILCHNLMASMQGEALRAFEPGGDYLLIFNLGDGTGIFHKRWLSFGGRSAFLVKNYLDRKFMRKFQALER